MSSLYDKYHSEQNVNHMYNLIKNIIKDNFNHELIHEQHYQNFVNILSETFINTNSNDISEINRELLNKYLNNFIDDLQSNENKTKEPITSTKNKITNDYNNFMELNNTQRENIPESNFQNQSQQSISLQNI